MFGIVGFFANFLYALCIGEIVYMYAVRQSHSPNGEGLWSATSGLDKKRYTEPPNHWLIYMKNHENIPEILLIAEIHRNFVATCHGICDICRYQTGADFQLINCMFFITSGPGGQ